MSEHSEECKNLWKSRGFPEASCLGVLYSCGHSFHCMYSDEARNHNHNGAARVEMIFWMMVWVSIMLAVVMNAVQKPT